MLQWMKRRRTRAHDEDEDFLAGGGAADEPVNVAHETNETECARFTQREKTSRLRPVLVGSVVLSGMICAGAAAWYAFAGDEAFSMLTSEFLSASTPQAAAETPKPPALPKAAESTRAAVKPAARADVTPAPVGTAAEPSVGKWGKSPFIYLSSLRAGTSGGEMVLPPIAGSGTRALPEIPRPAVSPELLPVPGEIRTPEAPQKPASLGGIITKSDGERIAILSDGVILSTGDTYRGDKRVTWIGGDGVTFDDGDSIPFGSGLK